MGEEKRWATSPHVSVKLAGFQILRQRRPHAQIADFPADVIAAINIAGDHDGVFSMNACDGAKRSARF
jgi:hypothetical protein